MSNKDKLATREYNRTWRAANPEKYKEYQREYHRRYKEDPANRLAHSARCQLLAALKMKGIDTEYCMIHFGTTLDDFKNKISKESEKEVNHLVPLRVFTEFFKSKNIDILQNWYGLRRIMNNHHNFQKTVKLSNREKYCYVDDNSIEAAKKLEKYFYQECKGLTEFVRNWTWDRNTVVAKNKETK